MNRASRWLPLACDTALEPLAKTPRDTTRHHKHGKGLMILGKRRTNRQRNVLFNSLHPCEEGNTESHGIVKYTQARMWDAVWEERTRGHWCVDGQGDMCIMRCPFVVGIDIGYGSHDTSDAITRLARNDSVMRPTAGIHQPRTGERWAPMESYRKSWQTMAKANSLCRAYIAYCRNIRSWKPIRK